VETRFKEVIRDLQAEHLIVRQIAANEYIIVFNHPNLPIEYVVAPARRPKEARVFTDFGRAVKVAVRMSGLKLMAFDLFDESDRIDAEA
jgi:hypothetical protein